MPKTKVTTEEAGNISLGRQKLIAKTSSPPRPIATTQLPLDSEKLLSCPTSGSPNILSTCRCMSKHKANPSTEPIPDARILPDDSPQPKAIDSNVKKRNLLDLPLQEKSVFPNVVTAEIVTLQVGGKATRCMKIVFEATTGQHQEPGPSGVELALPVPNIDDRWVIVALDLVPNLGLLVPGLSTFISAEFLGRAASTAVVRQCKVRYPIIYQLKNNENFQPGCVVCAIPPLPRHVDPFSLRTILTFFYPFTAAVRFSTTSLLGIE